MKESICIIKLLDYESQTAKHKKVLKCEQCLVLVKENCKERKDNNNGTSGL